jgi:polysaccharide pyruvyl transferase CsaB
MKKIFLIGYYGYKNYGDDLLFKSLIKILEEIKFEGKIVIPADELPEYTVNNSFFIEKISKYDILNINNHIKDTDVVIYGGGNLFQTETSLKSFYYYYHIAKQAIKNNKKILFLSQGFGPLKHKIVKPKLKKILNYDSLIGVYRDITSHKYAKKFNENSFLGVDIGPYYFKDTNVIKKNKISLCLKNEYYDIENLINFLSIFDDYEVSTLVINSNQDAIMNYYLVEEIREKTQLNALFPFKDFDKIIEEIKTSKIVISDRLHSSITAAYFNSIFFTYNNSKNKRVLKTIDKSYNFFYKNLMDIPFLYSDKESKNYDFKEYGEIYKEKLVQTIDMTKEVIRNALK